MVMANNIRICKPKYEDVIITNISNTLEPEAFHDEIIKCRKIMPKEMQRMTEKISKRLNMLGIDCYIDVVGNTKVAFRQCKLTQDYIDNYGYNVSSYSERRSRLLGWEDWVDFHQVVNDVMDEDDISAHVFSIGCGGFEIRKGMNRMSREDWSSNEHYNVGSMAQPISCVNRYITEDTPRDEGARIKYIRKTNRLPSNWIDWKKDKRDIEKLLENKIKKRGIDNLEISIDGDGETKFYWHRDNLGYGIYATPYVDGVNLIQFVRLSNPTKHLVPDVIIPRTGIDIDEYLDIVISKMKSIAEDYE